ncbi:MAG: PAS domain-containing protein [Bacteroidota bacterium]
MTSIKPTFFKSLADTLPFGVTIMELVSADNMDFRYVYANERMLQITGLQEEEFIGKRKRELYPQAFDGGAPFPTSLMKALETQSTVSLGLETFVDARMGPRLYEASSHFLGENTVALVIKEAVDVESLTLELSVQKQLLETGEKTTASCTWIMDSETGETKFTHTYLDIHHFKEGEITPMNATQKAIERIHPDDWERKAEFRNKKHAAFPVSITYRYLGKDGAYIWLKDTIFGKNPRGKTIGTTQDVTESQERERKLQESLYFQDKILSTSPDMVYLFDLISFQDEFVNRSTFIELGYTEEEVIDIGKALLPTLVHPDDLDRVMNHYLNVLPTLKDDQVVRISFRLLHKFEKIYVWFECSESVFEKSEDGKICKVIGIARNIDDRKRAEFCLEETNEKLQETLHFQNRILFTSPAIIYVYDLIKQRNVFANKSLTERLGYSEDDLQKMGGKFLQRTVHPEDVVKVLRHHSETLPNLEEGQTVKLEFRILSKNTNQYIWLESTESLFHKDGEEHSIIGIARSIHNQKVAEQEVMNTNHELEQFVYSVSHDLRAPVRHIISYSQLLKLEEENNLSQTGNDRLGWVMGASKRLGEMIDDLLAYSRNRNAKPDKSWINSHALVLEILTEFKESHPQQNISWKLDDIPNCMADSRMLRLVWENLISNAVKYSSKKEKTWISIQAEDKEEEVVFSIHDNGAGFDSAFANKLFTVFQRLHNREEFPGYGIGLANVARMIQHHDGRIWGESVLGEGASFYFSIPKEHQHKFA